MEGRETTYPNQISPPIPVHTKHQDTYAWQIQLELHTEHNNYKPNYLTDQIVKFDIFPTSLF